MIAGTIRGDLSAYGSCKRSDAYNRYLVNRRPHSAGKESAQADEARKNQVTEGLDEGTSSPGKRRRNEASAGGGRGSGRAAAAAGGGPGTGAAAPGEEEEEEEETS